MDQEGRGDLFLLVDLCHPLVLSTKEKNEIQLISQFVILNKHFVNSEFFSLRKSQLSPNHPRMRTGRSHHDILPVGPARPALPAGPGGPAEPGSPGGPMGPGGPLPPATPKKQRDSQSQM